MNPYIVDAETVAQLVAADAYGAQASVEWVISRIVLLQHRIAEGQQLVIEGHEVSQSIRSHSELDAWVAATLPDAWTVLRSRAN